MNYVSTRTTGIPGISSAAAIKRGLAPDGGLYMPDELPQFDEAFLAGITPLPYEERAAAVLGLFLTDYTPQELSEDAKAAYSAEKFGASPAPVRRISDMSVLELWHGPTCAFKDMALQIMPRLFCRALKKCGETRKALILVATSGDTGKAALEGYRDVDQTAIQVYYPTDGVSRMQKLQMQTQEGKNVSVHAIRGNFDDAQNGVKKIFSDNEMQIKLDKSNVFLSSANSINWGRLVPQIVYYVSAYCDMAAAGTIRSGEVIDVCVPTGNFGNIFAAYIAKRCGLPIGKLICASNDNDVLTEFLNTGRYNRNRPFHATISPSMDILISSNLERLLFITLGATKTAAYMKRLAEDGCYTLEPEDHEKIRCDFCGYSVSEEQTRLTIRETFLNENYLTDTHTAVAVTAARRYMRDSQAERKLLTVSTASAYKFAGDVLNALTGTPAPESPQALSALSVRTSTPIPSPLAELAGKTVRFTDILGKEDMASAVRSFADSLDQ